MALLLLAGAIGALRSGWIRIPPQHDPWAALDPAEPPGWLTRVKLMRLAADDELCRTVLARAGLTYTRLDDRVTGDGCGYANAVRVRELRPALAADGTRGVRPSTPFAASCRLAVSLALWERHVLQPAARELLGAPVERLEHLGSYACRNVGGREHGRRSQHATADALDVAGFVLADGRRITVGAGWQGDARDAAFLHRVRDGACPLFGSVLGPEYDAAHRDHLHLDRGRFGVCR